MVPTPQCSGPGSKSWGAKRDTYAAQDVSPEAIEDRRRRRGCCEALQSLVRDEAR
jgi:hypothetical protein